jgi:hypothetical protein
MQDKFEDVEDFSDSNEEFSDSDDFSDSELVQFGGSLLGGYTSDPGKAMTDLSGATASITGILATLAQLPGGDKIVEKITPIMGQIQSVAGIILGMNSGLKLLQEKVFNDLSNVMSTALNSAVTASNDATNKILANAGVAGLKAKAGAYSLDDEGNVVDPDGNVVGPPGSTIDPATGNVLDPDGNVVATPGDIAPSGTTPNTSGEAGDTGESGDTGEAGDTGESGDTGEAGDTGESGDTGEVTNTGDTGEVTNSGDTGEVTNSGDTGEVTNNSMGGGGKRRTMKWRNNLTRRKRK